VSGYELEVAPGVYKTGIDTELFIDSVDMSPSKDFLEIGCGCGAISIGLSARARSGLACDININAVTNTERNLERLGISNVRVTISDVFSQVSETFDRVIFNCPYTNHGVRDSIERMFWDPADESKRKFFGEAHNYLRRGGLLYFGWADFDGLDPELPWRLSAESGFTLLNTYARPVTEHGFKYYVFEYTEGI
jgi:methylase of polypeptide subunit release factors